MEKMLKEYAIDEMTEALIKLSGNSENQTIKNECYEYLYWLKAAAENPYNMDYFKIFWNVLQNITKNNEVNL